MRRTGGQSEGQSIPNDKEINSEPKPVAELEFPEGTMPTDSPFYVKREPWEERCCTQIDKPGGLVQIKAPRQMGKSSLMAQIRHYAEQKRDIE